MKKKLCALILAMACVCSLGTTGASAAGMDEQEGYSTTVISGEDAIQAYLEEVGEPYDPNLVEVIRVEYERNIENTPTPAFISREYERRNEKTRKYTDFTDTVAEYLRPAGRVSVDEMVSISHSFSATGGVNAEVLEATFGFDVTASKEFNVSWEQTYSYPIRLTVYPRYKEYTGEIWDKDIQFDDTGSCCGSCPMRSRKPGLQSPRRIKK